MVFFLWYLLRTRSRSTGFRSSRAFNVENAAGQFRLPSVKLLIRVGQRGVDDRPRRQHELHGVQRVIGILLDAATHAAGVIGEYAAQGAGRDGCRIRPDLRAIRYQRGLAVRR